MEFFSSQQSQPSSQQQSSQDENNWLWSEIQQQQQQQQQPYISQALGEEQQQQESYVFSDEQQQETMSRSSFWESQGSHGMTMMMYHNINNNKNDEEEEQDQYEYDDDTPPTTTTAATATATTTAATAPPSAPAAQAAAIANSNVVVVDHDYSPATVLHRIEQLTLALVDCLEQERLPVVTSRDAGNDSAAGDDSSDDNIIIKTTQFSLHQARSMTSLFLVLSYCFGLLQQGKTTTLREVYYCFVTHFRHQRECCAAIRQATLLLGVPRHALGLTASPRGWYCGDVQIRKLVVPPSNDNSNSNSRDSDDDESRGSNSRSTDNEYEYKMVMDGRNLQSMHGSPIDAGWLVMPQQLESNSNNEEDDESSTPTPPPLFQIQTVAAQFILVVEKEGIYNRLSEDRFFDTYPCILVTGKGFPDFSTRALVQTLHKQLQLPVYGLVDCNPFGIQILNTYRNVPVNNKNNKTKRRLPMDSEEQEDESQEMEENDGGDNEDDNPNDDETSSNRGVPVQWLGLRPSQLAHFKSSLPAAVFQPLTDIDRKRLYALLSINEADILEQDDDADHGDSGNASDNGEDMDDDDDDDDLASMSSSVLEQQHPWIRQQNASRRRHELQLMLENNCKVELEALHWLGMDALSEFLSSVLEYEEIKQQRQQLEEENAWERNQGDMPSGDDDDDETCKGSSWMDII